MRLRGFLGRQKRWLRETYHWSVHELPKSPGLELYARKINKENMHLATKLREGGEFAFQDYARPYLNRDIPRTLWIFWGQGEDAAPPIVQNCIASWRRKNPDWDIRVLDKDMAQKWADLSDVPAHLPFRFRADLLRLRLLSRHGGVWADATTFCHRPLSEWLPLLGGQTGFFAFVGPSSDRWISSWFIAAHPENPLIATWHEAYRSYIVSAKAKPKKYFMVIYALQWQLLRNPILMTHFRRTGSLPAVPCFFLQAALEGKIDTGIPRKAIQNGLPLSKLSWKVPVSEALLEGILEETEA